MLRKSEPKDAEAIRQVQVSACPADASNAWLLMSLLVVIFFLYQLILMYTVVTTSCTLLEDFWLAPDQLRINPFTAFVLVFSLFGIWALVEVVVAHIGGYSDRWICTFICSVSLVCVLATLATLRMQWEYYEVQWGVRSFQNFTFELMEMPEIIYVDPWREFLTEKMCDDPELHRRLRSEETWIELEKEFLDGGGTFEYIEIGG
ncbi:hypothetical protein [Marinimicrobium alkaliphilum]|uniref:hypothetical protein n=1 Tax=Marinimicrobium alkaliphilum TaxID=2202654 RepID=UPI000DBA7101|nr:hypothetical protein [Marinimicrobium alkaliphilum]